MNPSWPSARSSSRIALIVAILLQARGRAVRDVRRRLRGLPQPARNRAPALAVHDRAARRCSSLFSLAAYVLAAVTTA